MFFTYTLKEISALGADVGCPPLSRNPPSSLPKTIELNVGIPIGTDLFHDFFSVDAGNSWPCPSAPNGKDQSRISNIALV
jgi:hypothetical protein